MVTSLGQAVGKRLVAVMPHPDDESYSCAGTLAMAADAGAEVSLIAASRGEGGWVRDPELHGGRPLGALRTEELEASCKALGIASPIFLDWPDGGIAGLAEERRAAELKSALASLEPDVIITLAADGVYGHRDHVALTQTCIEVCQGSRLLLADFPRGLFAPLARRFLGFAPDILTPDLDPDSLGLDPGGADITIDIGAVATRKRAAIAAHDSQLRSAEPLVFLLPDLVAAVCEHEWFTIASGDPRATVFPS